MSERCVFVCVWGVFRDNSSHPLETPLVKTTPHSRLLYVDTDAVRINIPNPQARPVTIILCRRINDSYLT